MPAIAAHDGPVYMRLLRGNVPLVLDEYDYRFELGKAKLLRDGTDVLIVSTGFMTMRALEAAELLRKDRIEVARAARADHQAARRGDDPGRGRRAPAGWWSWPRTTRSSAAWARRWRACCCAPA